MTYGDWSNLTPPNFWHVNVQNSKFRPIHYTSYFDVKDLERYIDKLDALQTTDPNKAPLVLYSELQSYEDHIPEVNTLTYAY